MTDPRYVPPPPGPHPGQPYAGPPHPPQPYPGPPQPPYGGPPQYAGPPPQVYQPTVQLSAVERRLGQVGQLAAPALVVLGLALENGTQNAYEAYTAWAIFATVLAVAQLISLLGPSFNISPPNAWTLGAVATGALVLYWVLVVLPGISQDTSFYQTIGVGGAVLGVWLSPWRRL